MKIKTFIDRPILSGVISTAIVIAGLISLVNLPVEQYPDIAPPTVRVNTSYTGANAETVLKSVVTPLEEAINGVENMMYMTSNSLNTGSASISVYFKQGTNADMALVNVQNRVAEAQSLLPAEVTKSGVTVRKRLNSVLKEIALFSPDDSYDKNFLVNYLKINIEPQLSRIPGVGEVGVWGPAYSMRIWLDPTKMAQYNLVPADIDEVLDEQNVESPTGTLGAESEQTFRYVLKYRGRYELEEEFRNLVIRADSKGHVLRLGDVAQIEMGVQDYDMRNQTNGHPGAGLVVQQTPGSNANQIVTEIDNTLSQVSQSLPKGMEIADVMSVNDFLDQSIDNVVETLIIAVILVVLVVYAFLHDMRTTLIPTLAIMISLVGTFAFMYVAGFSLNLLTLFALVLVIGTVVDDAIVVAEAVQANLDNGYSSPYEASVSAMEGLTSALFTTTTVFMAVFIPVSFLGGTSGKFYTQFGLTMAAAVAISLLNALTLCPALCALIMRPKIVTEGYSNKTLSSKFKYAFDASFQRIQTRYNKLTFALMHKKGWVTVSIVFAFMVLFMLMKHTKTGLVPQEDMGTINIIMQLSPGSNLDETEQVMDEIDKILADIPQIKIYSRVAGKGSGSDRSASSGSFTIRLQPWSQRKKKGDDINSVIKEIYKRTSHITSAKIRLSTRPMIPGYSSSGGFELYVQDKHGGTIEQLLQNTNNFIREMNNQPQISRAYTTFDTKYPQYYVEVDAFLCKQHGVSPTDVLDALSGYVGGSYSSNLNRFTKLYRVMVQAAPEYRLNVESLDNMYIRTDNGTMAPLSEFVSLTKVYGSESLSRFNLFPAIVVNGMPADGYSSGQTIQAIEKAARKALPEGYGYEFSGMTREEAANTDITSIVLVVCFVFVYLILCALYESLLIPFAVILSVPFGLVGSFVFAQIWGLENNIYMQTGLIMLIGLLSKTAILLTEYAGERRRKGLSLTAAAMSAAKARLRPILMTSLTMIFGMLPLMFSHGVGANGNKSVGVTTVGGMVFGTAALLFVVPTLFIVFRYIEEKLLSARKR